MTRKKKTLTEKVEDAGNAIENAVTAVIYCGHINKQSYNKENELEDVACTREKGHAGDHSAEVEGKEVAWSDAAGKPARSNKYEKVSGH